MRTSTLTPLIFALFCLSFLAACGEHKRDQRDDFWFDTYPSDTTSSSDDGGSDEDLADHTGCSGEGLEVSKQHAIYYEADGSSFTLYQGETGAIPFSRLEVELLMNPSPGSFVLQGENYAECEVCVLFWQDCEQDSCERLYFATEGTIDVSTWEQPGGQLVGKVRDLVLSEVNIDWDTYQSTPVVNGQVWCIDEMNLQAPVVFPQGN